MGTARCSIQIINFRLVDSHDVTLVCTKILQYDILPASKYRGTPL